MSKAKIGRPTESIDGGPRLNRTIRFSAAEWSWIQEQAGETRASDWIRATVLNACASEWLRARRQDSPQDPA